LKKTDTIVKKLSNIKELRTIFLIFFLIFILIKNNNFFKNSFKLIYTNYELRLQSTAYGFCEISGHQYSKNLGTGYIFFIKDKFDLKKIPIIRDFNISPNQRWIFQNYDEINENKIIILNNLDNDGNPKFKFDKYKILHNHKNNCLFLEKND
tara:strand:+ start:292 stop:747 length:456 start_codon:yes stop_codon:yes gene_type:complete